MDAVSVVPVGVVRGGRSEPDDDAWAGVAARIELDARFAADALAGLADFSHVEIVFQFHRVAEAEVTTGARHPRGRTDWPKVGIFAQRGRVRPNRIGVSVCRLTRVSGTTLEVEGLDAIDGSPVLDIKPYLIEFAPRGIVRQAPWASELMRRYW